MIRNKLENYEFCLRNIQTCRTEEQLKSASNLAKLFCNLYTKDEDKDLRDLLWLAIDSKSEQFNVPV